MSRTLLTHALIVVTLVVALARPTPAYAATFTVTTISDAPDAWPGDGICGIVFSLTPPYSSGPCSLRAAIQESNSLAGTHEIRFAIPPGGVQTIAVTSELPTIIYGVVIDGRSQGGAGYTGPPLIELSGVAAGAGARGLVLVNDGHTVYGLAINRFSGAGIEMTGSGNRLQWNYIGTSPAGTVARPNGTGLKVNGQRHIIANNLISGNAGSGLYLMPHASFNTIEANLIGTNAAGTSGLGNAVGIEIWGTHNGVGGFGPGAGNVIAFNSGTGVEVALAGSGTWSNPILRNSIHSNGALGIDLAATIDGRADGVTPNDAGDADLGGNRLQNHPLLTSVTPGPGSTVAGTLTSEPSTSYFIDVFSSPTCDSSGRGEGRTYVGAAFVTTNSSGSGTFSASVAALTLGHVVTATATNTATLDTSELSPCLMVAIPPCAPRPNVKLTALPTGTPGLLQVTLQAQTSLGTPTNGLQQIAFGALNNAQVLVNGAPVAAGATVPLGGAPTFTFVVKRIAGGQHATVHFTARDTCGDWPSFVGGGPNAF